MEAKEKARELVRQFCDFGLHTQKSIERTFN